MVNPDQELLELAAKAAGIEHDGTVEEGACILNEDRSWRRFWNPLTDDGDAFRLSVKLGLNIVQQHTFAGPERVAAASGFCADDMRLTSTDYEGDPLAATRRAIVLAAAIIGRNIK